MGAKLYASSSPRVMIVDDEDCIRQTVYELLTTEGIAAVTATGAQECLKLMHDGFRGIILMDVMMPGKNGWETIREIEHEGLLQGNIISMLTAMDAPDEQMDGLQEVVIDYIIKPFDPDVFLASVRKYLAIIDQIGPGN